MPAWQATSIPPPAAAPLTAAMYGLSRYSSARGIDWTP